MIGHAAVYSGIISGIISRKNWKEGAVLGYCLN